MKLSLETNGLVRDILHTFIESQSKIQISKRLTIVIRPEDLKGVKLNEISETVLMECRRHRRSNQEGEALGSKKGTMLT